MPKKFLSFIILLFILVKSNAQIEVSKLIGKNSSDYKIGYGGFLKFSYPVSDGDDVSLETGVHIFFDKDYSEYGMADVPLKVGYRYTLNRAGTGFYVEPQLGYNIYGVNSYYDQINYKDVDEKFHGIILSGGVGYLFQPGIVQFDLGIRYESVMYNGKSLNYVSFRLTHNFSFKKRDDY